MVSVLTDPAHGPGNPIDTLEELADQSDFPFSRHGAHELMVSVAGGWCAYQIDFHWLDGEEALQITCAFEARVTDMKYRDMCELLVRINGHLAAGHFDLARTDGLIMYRHAVLLRGSAPLTRSQCHDLISVAVESCEQFYPAFQFVLWGGQTPEEAVRAALLEPEGEA